MVTGDFNFFRLFDCQGWKERNMMGDKGKKDREKSQKQNSEKQHQKDKKKADKQPKKAS
jgi:hypothetical protein